MYLLIFLITFFPVIEIFNIQIPTISVFFITLLLKKQIKLNKKMLKISLFSIIVFLLLSLLSYFQYHISIQNLIYPFILIYTCLLYCCLDNYINEKNQKKLIKGMKFFMIIQLVFCILQFTNFLGSNEILSKLYFYWQRVNAGKAATYLEISYRPFGTTGNPIYTAITCYLFGQTIKAYTKDKKYYYLSLIIILLCGARMALIAFLLIEIYINIIKKIGSKPLTAIFRLTLVCLILYLGYQYVPFIQKYILMIINGDSNILNDYSISYRLSMFDLFKYNSNYILFGGIGIENLPSYVDCEYILRILQFGLIGFAIYLLPFGYLFKTLKKNDIVKSIILFLILMMITVVIMTNLYFIPYLLITLIMLERGDKKCE